MKKFLFIILTMLCVSAAPVYANSGISVVANDIAVEFDVPPQIIDGRTMVPMRPIFEALDAQVEWFANSQLILATHNADIAAMVIGNSEFTVTNVLSGKVRTIEFDVPPRIIDDRTLIPVRAVSEALGMDVQWDEYTKTVVISMKVI